MQWPCNYYSERVFANKERTFVVYSIINRTSQERLWCVLKLKVERGGIPKISITFPFCHKLLTKKNWDDDRTFLPTFKCKVIFHFHLRTKKIQWHFTKWSSCCYCVRNPLLTNFKLYIVLTYLNRFNSMKISKIIKY